MKRAIDVIFPVNAEKSKFIDINLDKGTRHGAMEMFGNKIQRVLLTRDAKSS